MKSVLLIVLTISTLLGSCRHTGSQTVSDALAIARRGGSGEVTGRERLEIGKTYIISAQLLRVFTAPDIRSPRANPSSIEFGKKVELVTLSPDLQIPADSFFVGVKIPSWNQDQEFFVSALYLENSTDVDIVIENTDVTEAVDFASAPASWNGDKLFTDRDSEWAYEKSREVAKDLNENGGAGKYGLKPKPPGGSSRQLFVTQNGKPIGIFSPPMHATYILGEIFPYNIARIMNRTNWVATGVRMTLKGKGAKKVKDIYKAWGGRDCNIVAVNEYFKKNSNHVHGVFIPFDGRRPKKAKKLVNTNRSINELNHSHFLVNSIAGKTTAEFSGTVYYNGRDVVKTSGDYKEPKIDAAAQLSLLMVLDALAWQRDRLNSGGNMEVFVDKRDGSFVISPIDNGGITDFGRSTPSIRALINKRKGVRAFERIVVDSVREMQKIVTSGRGVINGNTVGENELKRILGYENFAEKNRGFRLTGKCSKIHYPPLFGAIGARWKVRWKKFKSSLKIVTQYFDELERRGKLVYIK